jgi:lysophospholipase L1-like esterase
MKLKRLLPLFLSVLIAGAAFTACNSKGGSGTKDDDKGVVDAGKDTDTDADKDKDKDDGVGEGGDVAKTLDANTKIYVVGDSTVCAFNDNYYLPRYGYGTQLKEYFNLASESQIVNLALSGRSSLSFITDSEYANYTTLTSSIKQGDYLIIGFGHNDEKDDDDARYTDPTKSYTDTSTDGGPSFQYTLYNYYVKMATEKGATPILCTPIVRYSSSADYSGTNGHITSKGDYPAAIRVLATATSTTLVDLTAITKADYQTKGEEAQYYHAATTYKETDGVKVASGLDSTHINKYGAKMVAYEFATALKQTSCSLKDYVKDNITAPTKDAEYEGAIKTDYVKPPYTAFDASSNSANLLGTISGQSWYKTAMGDIGGDNKVSNFTISKSGDNVTVSNSGTNGKIAGTSDGFAGAFIQIDKNKNFTASATVTLKTFPSSSSNQAAFGMMLRDDIYVDTNSSSITSNYVAAGALASSTGGAIFSRENSKLTKNTGNAVTLTEGASYTVSITRVGQTVTVTFNDGTNNYTKTYTDFDFVAVDNDYMYLCLFANRGITAEFSNISFEITGEAQGA